MKKWMLLLILFITPIAFLLVSWVVDSPHGKELKISCSVCHSAKGWQLDKEIYSYDHNTAKFALSGIHATVTCKACHPTLVFTDAGTSCRDCHTDVHEASVGQECGRCHTPDSWLVRDVLSLHSQSRFPLLGAHAIAECTDCHASESFLQFRVNGIDCYDCHQKDFQATTDPNHVESGFSTTCYSCHRVSALTWGGGGFDHSFFPLHDGHDIKVCSQCHQSGGFSGLSPACYSCHASTFQGTANPNHVAAGFSTSCNECHSLLPGWKPAKIDHSAFPLTLGHASASCLECHSQGIFAGLDADCYSCHQKDFNATTNPPHLSGGFPTQCTVCHTTNPNWKPASFNHNAFPLTLGHSSVACAECHISGNYSNTSTECFSCHQGDFNATTQPNHAISHIGSTCTECHTTNNNWKPVYYPQHDPRHFPVYSGKHAGNWDACTDCHTNVGNYSVNSCIICHEHNKTETDSHHREVPNYSYTSAACLNCHPRGNSD